MKTSVYEYVDFREYLKAVYHERKEQYRFFSHRYFLRQVGVRNSGYLKLIIDGKRSLTPEMCQKFGKALGLAGQEFTYFQYLVEFCQAKTAEKKEDCFRQLKFLGAKVKRKTIAADLFDYFEHWHTPVIRELVCLHNFSDDFEKIGAAINPPVKAKDVKKAMEFLLDKKMLVRRENGTYAQTDPAIDTTDEITSLVVRCFNRQMIVLANEALDRWRKEERYIRGFTVGISKETYQALVSEIQKFNDRVVQIVGTDTKSDRVYQLNTQLFPLTYAQTNQPGQAIPAGDSHDKV